MLSVSQKCPCCCSRVGILIEDEKENFELPADVLDIADKWVITDRKDTQCSWDFLWNGSAEEGREKQALEEAFVLELDDAIIPPKDVGLVNVAESAMKVRCEAVSRSNKLHSQVMQDDVRHSK